MLSFGGTCTRVTIRSCHSAGGEGRIVYIIGRGIDLGNNNRGDGSVSGSEFIPDGGQGLAVATPGGIELHQHVLGGVVHDVLERVCDQNLHGAVVGLRHRLALDEGFEATGFEFCEPLRQRFNSNGLVFGENESNAVLVVVEGKGGDLAGEAESCGLLRVLVVVDPGHRKVVLVGDQFRL